jgi:AcrR family transcriptional regulator
MTGAMDKRADRGRATRDQLVAVATELFAQRGFDGTSIEAVLEAAGVSRGSLYHHFASKEALFEAVLDAVEARISEETNALLATLGETDSLGALRAGGLAWIRLAGDPVVQRIVLIDAPAVLGWERWRAIEEQNALGTIKVVMQLAAQEGRIGEDLVDTFAHVLLATMNELALMIARATDT